MNANPVVFASDVAASLTDDFGPTLVDDVRTAASNSDATRDVVLGLSVASSVATIGMLVWEVSKLVWARWSVVDDKAKLADEIKTFLAEQTVVTRDQLAEIVEKAIEKANNSV